MGDECKPILTRTNAPLISCFILSYLRHVSSSLLCISLPHTRSFTSNQIAISITRRAHGSSAPYIKHTPRTRINPHQTDIICRWSKPSREDVEMPVGTQRKYLCSHANKHAPENAHTSLRRHSLPNYYWRWRFIAHECMNTSVSWGSGVAQCGEGPEYFCIRLHAKKQTQQ
jgi:hypothetical protein